MPGWFDVFRRHFTCDWLTLDCCLISGKSETPSMSDGTVRRAKSRMVGAKSIETTANESTTLIGLFLRPAVASASVSVAAFVSGGGAMTINGTRISVSYGSRLSIGIVNWARWYP